MKIPSKKEKELRKIAQDIFNDLIFTNIHIPIQQAELLNFIFIPIGTGFLDNWSRKDCRNIGMYYEYRDKAISRDFKLKYPVFESVNILNKKDARKVINLLKQITDD